MYVCMYVCKVFFFELCCLIYILSYSRASVKRGCCAGSYITYLLTPCFVIYYLLFIMAIGRPFCSNFRRPRHGRLLLLLLLLSRKKEGKNVTSKFWRLRARHKETHTVCRRACPHWKKWGGTERNAKLLLRSEDSFYVCRYCTY